LGVGGFVGLGVGGFVGTGVGAGVGAFVGTGVGGFVGLGVGGAVVGEGVGGNVVGAFEGGLVGLTGALVGGGVAKYDQEKGWARSQIGQKLSSETADKGNHCMHQITYVHCLEQV
jgi:hypothetical protein